MAKNTTIQMTSGTTISDSAATIDVPDDGILVGAHLRIRGATMDAEGDAAGMEVGFGSTAKGTVNDARTVIGFCSVGVNLAAAGIVESVNQVVLAFPDGIEVFAGERLHLHTSIAGGGTIASAHALLIFRFKKFSARRR